MLTIGAVKTGENIKRLRKSRRWTQDRLGEMLGVTRAAVAQWEASQTDPAIDRLRSIAKAFRVPLHEVIGTTPRKDGAA